MHNRLLVSFLAAGAAVAQSIGADVNSDGILELLSNHFGRPGYNVTYDYIVVGGGNAGNTIAARLALDPANYSVAVIEAGNFYEIVDGNRTQIPGLNYLNNLDFEITSGTTSTAYGLKTVPQPGYNNRQILTVTGHTFGGGTAANNMIYQRATEGTFAKWASDVDDDFWSWENVYPAYQKSCEFFPPDFTKIDTSFNITWDEEAFNDDGGPLHVSYGNYFSPAGSVLSDQLEAHGFQQIDGANSGHLIGHTAMTSTLDPRTATRDSSETSFLQAAARGSNIKIYPNALVQRVTFDGNKRATGVDVRSNFAYSEVDWHLSARKEVILSAGVWYSPQLLMLSGVGPAETLQEHGIEVVADVPGVGQNEWDQATISLIYKVNVTTGTQFQKGNPQAVAAIENQYLEQQSGPLSGSGVSMAAGWEKYPAKLRKDFKNSTLSHLATFPADWPEIEYVYLDYVPLGAVETALGREIEPDENFLSSGCVLLTTASRGNMTIKSADILDRPLISPNWLIDDGDVEQAYAAFQRAREFMAGSSIAIEEVIPGPEITEREDVITWLRDHMGHIYHGVSTCKMGSDDDELAVLDSRARVRGVTGLRVVDASALPLAPPGQPMSAIYMFAEKIAESILNGD